MTFADGSAKNEIVFNSAMDIIIGQYKVPGTIASKDLTTGYLNTRDGVIPTGVIMAVAPFAVVTLLGGAGVVTMVMKKNKKEEE